MYPQPGIARGFACTLGALRTEGDYGSSLVTTRSDRINEERDGPENPMFPTPHPRTGESFPHPLVSYETSGDQHP